MDAPPIPPKTQDRLNEAAARLWRMEETEERPESFLHEVSGFLAAARSVKDALWKELVDAGRGEEKKVRPAVEEAMRADSEMQLLISYRNDRIHTNTDLPLLECRMEEVPLFWTGRTDGNDDWARRHILREQRARERSPFLRRSRSVTPGPAPKQCAPCWYFRDIADRDAYAVCRDHLEKIRRVVSDCLNRFP